MDKSTDINDLPFKKPNNNGGLPNNPMAAMGQSPPNPVNTSPDGVQPSARFAQMPGSGPSGLQRAGPAMPSGMMQAGMGPQVGGPGQGMSAPEKPTSGKKEFFGLNETDYKSTVVVFALILIFSSSIFFEMMKTYLPAVMQDGKTTFVGSLIAALLGSVIYIVVKCVANLT